MKFHHKTLDGPDLLKYWRSKHVIAPHGRYIIFNSPPPSPPPPFLSTKVATPEAVTVRLSSLWYRIHGCQQDIGQPGPAQILAQGEHEFAPMSRPPPHPPNVMNIICYVQLHTSARITMRAG